MKYAAVLVAVAFLLVAGLRGEHDSGIEMVGAPVRLSALDGASNDERGRLLTAWLEEQGLAVEFQPVASTVAGAGRERVGNLVVTLGSGSRDIVIGAHYDAPFSGGRITGGIVDNGAAALVLGRLATELGDRTLSHRIRIVWFDVEEADQQGSLTYVEENADRTAAMINLDVIGLGDTAIYGPTGNPANLIMADVMQKACADGGHSCMNFARVPLSDDTSFAAEDIPVLSVGVFPRVEAHQFWLALHGGDGSGLGHRTQPRTLKIVNSLDDGVDETSIEAMELAFCVLRDLVLRLDEVLS